MKKNKSGRYFCSKRCRWELARRRRDPRVTARSLLNSAVQTGKLQKGTHCNRCGSVDDLQGHHADYAKPVDVEWICRPCHDLEHYAVRVAEVEKRRKHFDPCPCGRKAICKGLCATCYSRKRNAAMLAICVAPGCPNKQNQRGVCNTHRLRPEFFLAKQRPGAKAA